MSGRRRQRRAIALLLLGLGASAAVGCAAVETAVNATAEVAENSGLAPKGTTQSTKKVTAAFRKSAEEFTDSEEHYIGRSVAANMFVQYRPVDNEALNQYVSRVGTAVALASDRPETFGGYRFQVLDSEEINAFAAPGGLIFITRGTLLLCEDEDMLACVLAHEVGHVVMKHGLKSISSTRLKEAFATLTGEAAQLLSEAQAKDLAVTLHASVGDITGAIHTGYGRGAEKDADRLAVIYASRAGYDPWALGRFLEAMQRREGVAKGGTFETHPKADVRLEVVKETIEDEKLGAPPAPPATRATRFKAAVGA